MVSKEENVEKVNEEIKHNWEKFAQEFGLKKELLRGIYAFGIKKPSSVLEKTFHPIINGRDVIAQARSGLCKVSAYVISSLQIIDITIPQVQALVLAPTRENCSSVHQVYTMIGEGLKVKAVKIIGGLQDKENMSALEGGVHVAVGTPGRVIELINKNRLKLTYLKVLIFDEADNLLKRDFLANMKEIITLIPNDCKKILFSGYMPKEIAEFSSNFMNEPAKVIINYEKIEINMHSIKHYYHILKKECKLETLMNLYKGLDISQAIIFCNDIKTVDIISEEMKKKGHMVSKIYSEMTINERTQEMDRFIKEDTRVLISTDLTAIGIHAYKINIVINYDLPNIKESHFYKEGRSGRYGRTGNAIYFILPEEKDQLDQIMKLYDTHIEQLPQDLNEIK